MVSVFPLSVDRHWAERQDRKPCQHLVSPFGLSALFAASCLLLLLALSSLSLLQRCRVKGNDAETWGT